MCYFSAEGHSRSSREDEVLVVKRQPHGTNWLVSPDDGSTAVCLRPGTECELLFIPDETRQKYGVPQEIKATFKIKDWWRRDLFVLKNGRKVQLKHLQPGQVVRVLSVETASGREEFSLQEERR
jgi:hypothetical protein